MIRARDDMGDRTDAGVREQIAPRALVVDQDEHVSAVISTVLRHEGFDVRLAATGAEAISIAPAFEPDLVLLEVDVPDLDGLGVRARFEGPWAGLPIVYLTGRDVVGERLRGLTFGADDYVVKPFSPEALVATVHAVLRRANASGAASSELVYADLELHDDRREVRRGGQVLALSPTEYNLLRFLLANAGRVLSKAQILDHVWRYDFGGDGNVVETYISYLRRKVDRHRAPLIHTVRGHGYVLRLPSD